MDKIKKSVRVCFVAYALTTYVLAMVFSGLNRPENKPWLFVVVAGLVFYIVAGIALQIMQHRDKRPVWELAVLAGYPFLAFHLQFKSTAFLTTAFWRYAGWSYFLIMAGGFILAIVLAPLFARLRGAPAGQVGEVLKLGKAHVARYGWKGVGGVIALCALLCAPILYVAWLAMRQANELQARKSWPYAAYVGLGALIMLALTYRHTLFGLLERDRGG